MIEVNIEADSQEEFDAKRADLAKAIIGPKAIAPRKAYHHYQNELMGLADRMHERRTAQMKKEISVVIDRAIAREKS